MYDTIILGGGPAGMTAALYACRYGLRVLLIEEMYMGGQIINTHEIENYPGFQPMSGFELSTRMDEQLKKYDLDTVNDTVIEVSLDSCPKTVRTGSGVYEGRTLIIATGQNPKKMGLAREDELRGKGVSYCATCDGNFFRGQDVAVVGGGDTAVTEAVFLSRICRTVYVIHRREQFRAAKAETDKLVGATNIVRLMNSKVTELRGETELEGLAISDGLCDKSIDVKAVFVAVGATPNTAMFVNALEMDENGYILTDEDMKTNVENVFAAGDVRRKSLRQVITAAADGALAAHQAMLAAGSE